MKVLHTLTGLCSIGAAICALFIALEWEGEGVTNTNFVSPGKYASAWNGIGCMVLFMGLCSMFAGAYKGGPNERNPEAGIALLVSGCQNGPLAWLYGTATGGLIAVAVCSFQVASGFKTVDDVQNGTYGSDPYQELRDAYDKMAVCSLIGGIFLLVAAVAYWVFAVFWPGQGFNAMGWWWSAKNGNIGGGYLMAGVQFIILRSYYIEMRDIQGNFITPDNHPMDPETQYWLILGGFVMAGFAWLTKAGGWQAPTEEETGNANVV